MVPTRISRSYGRNAATKTLITIGATMRPARPNTSMPPRSTAEEHDEREQRMGFSARAYDSRPDDVRGEHRDHEMTARRTAAAGATARHPQPQHRPHRRQRRPAGHRRRHGARELPHPGEGRDRDHRRGPGQDAGRPHRGRHGRGRHVPIARAIPARAGPARAGPARWRGGAVARWRGGKKSCHSVAERSCAAGSPAMDRRSSTSG